MTEQNVQLNPVVVLANDARFTPDWKPFNASVESRMCLWCKSGHGSILVNGQQYEVNPFDYFVLPWRHSIRYAPDPDKPFLVAGIHLIPWHDPDVPVEWGAVPHNSKHPLHTASHRQDRHIEGLDEVLHFQLHDDHALIHLSEYVVQSYKRSHGRRELQGCARLLISELQHTTQEDVRHPEPIRRLRQFVERHMGIPLGVDDLASEIDRSPSQVNRLCQAHLGRSPGQWIAAIKMEHCCHLLRSTRHSVAEVGQAAGYHDQFHFSRVFKKHMGLSPLKYRQRQRLI